MCYRPSWHSPLIPMTLVALAMALAGCNTHPMPRRLIDGVNQVTLNHKVRDTRAQRIESWPCLRVDAALNAELNSAMTTGDLATAKRHATRSLSDAHRLSLESTCNELARLDESGWRELANSYFRAGTLPTEYIKARIYAAFKEHTDLQVWFLTRQVQEVDITDRVRAVLNLIRKQIELPVMELGRTIRAAPFCLLTLPSALAAALIHADQWHGDLDVPFDTAVCCRPVSGLSLAKTTDAPDHWDLLQWYAPVIVQERPRQVTYDRNDDQFGMVWVDIDQTIRIDTDTPAVYAYAREVPIHGRRRTQLTYAYWYPEHPKLKNIDPEAGRIEGVTFRITLDANHDPVISETLYNCGCYHRVYPADDLEFAAALQFGKPEHGKHLSIEKKVPGKIDMIIPKTVAVPANPGQPIIRDRAGYHAIVNVAFDGDGHEHEIRDQQRYTLLPYEQLERLVMPDGRVTSMFYDNGMVRDAQRLEGVFFTPLGMLSAGQPRQRGTQAIH